MRTKAAAIFVAFLVTTTSIAAQSSNSAVRSRVLETIPGISVADAATLVREGELSFRFNRDSEEPLLKLAPEFGTAIERQVRDLEPTIGVEVLFLLDAPPQARELDANLYEIMHAIGTMEGIEYFSASRNRMRTFFHESYVIAGPDSRERIPDPAFSSVRARSTIHVFQRDSSFGENVYRLDYRTRDGALWLGMNNLTQMWYQGIRPALGPELLQRHLVIRPIGDKLLFYGVSAARPGFLFGMENRVKRSFYNRLVALHDWFIDQISAAEGIRSREQDPGRAR